jgi:tetratricopeptide (TPR) repeat protein
MSLAVRIRLLLGSILLMLAHFAAAEPVVPLRDDQVVEVLPAVAGNRADERKLRQQLAAEPTNPLLALQMARRYLDQAHELGDPRFAGLALAALAPWTDDDTMPPDVLLMQATLAQYLHDFDGSVVKLQRLLDRQPAMPQAWLTLATVRRVQGRYADSDAACRQVGQTGGLLHGNACLAENAALRGDTDKARAALGALMVGRLPPETSAWLMTTVAELEQRAGRADAADKAYQAVLRLTPNDAYAVIDYADFLIAQRRAAEVPALLKDQVRTDAVVLRLAMVEAASHAASTAPSMLPDSVEMRERIALANERPDAQLFHGREQAMFALWVDHQPQKALALARANVVHQREPLDVLVFAQAARESGQAQALKEVRELTTTMGLKDQRVEALL